MSSSLCLSFPVHIFKHQGPVQIWRGEVLKSCHLKKKSYKWVAAAHNKGLTRIHWALCFKIQKCEAYYSLRHRRRQNAAVLTCHIWTRPKYVQVHQSISSWVCEFCGSLPFIFCLLFSMKCYTLPIVISSIFISWMSQVIIIECGWLKYICMIVCWYNIYMYMCVLVCFYYKSQQGMNSQALWSFNHY